MPSIQRSYVMQYIDRVSYDSTDGLEAIDLVHKGVEVMMLQGTITSYANNIVWWAVGHSGNNSLTSYTVWRGMMWSSDIPLYSELPLVGFLA
jgi:hypothetical protein